MRESGLQMPKPALPVPTYPNVRSAPVLAFAIFGAPWRILERTPDSAAAYCPNAFCGEP
jgi:hypothetical protein